MHSDSPRQGKRTWEELAASASNETDPEKVAMIAEEIFAALEERANLSHASGGESDGDKKLGVTVAPSTAGGEKD